MVNGFNSFFFASNGLSRDFPYVTLGGSFAEFPIYIIGICGILFSGNIRKCLKENSLLHASYGAIATVVVVVISEIAMSPYIIQRYHLDISFLLAILSFLVISFLYDGVAENKKIYLTCGLMFLAVITITTTFLMFYIPVASNYMSYYPEKLEAIQHFWSKFDKIIY